MNDLQARINILRPAAGDAIVVTVPRPVTREQADQIRQAFGAVLPVGVKVAVMDASLCLTHVVAPQPAPASTEAEVLGFDAWMRKRTNDAHAAYMKRTSVHLVCDWFVTRVSSPDEVNRFFNKRPRGVVA